MSYEKAMEAAGAKIIAFENFGSYQGEWWALVSYEGQSGWVNGSFGSCSGCDAFESEFGWNDEDKPDYQERLAEFGKGYLETLMSQFEAVEVASKNISWDVEAEDMVKFIKEHEGLLVVSIQ